MVTIQTLIYCLIGAYIVGSIATYILFSRPLKIRLSDMSVNNAILRVTLKSVRSQLDEYQRKEFNELWKELHTYSEE